MRIHITLTTIFFFIVMVLQLLRLVYRWHIQVEDFVVPYWVSIIGVAVPLALCVFGAVLLVRTRHPKP